MLLSWLKRDITASPLQFLIPVVLDLSYCDKLSALRCCTWLCDNKYIMVDPYKVDKVIVEQPAAFIKGYDDQIICMENSLHTNGDIIVNTAFKKLKILP